MAHPDETMQSWGVSKKGNKNFMNDFTTKITKDLITSIHKIGSTFSSVIKTVRMAVHNDLGLKTYSRMPRNLLQSP